VARSFKGQIMKWAGFTSGTRVIYKENGINYLATVADSYSGSVGAGRVPIVLIPEGCLLCVPADSLYT